MHNNAPLVDSPPSAPDLTSLLTGHVGRDGGQQGADGITTMDPAVTNTGADGAAATGMDINPPVADLVDNNVKSPKKKK